MTLSVLINLIFLGVLLPAITAGLIYLILQRFSAKFAAPLAVYIGFLVGFFGISGLGGYAFPPKTVQNWFPHIATAALALGLLEQFWLKPQVLRWIVRIVLLELFLWRIFQPFINHPFPSRSWTNAQTALNLLATSLIILLFWWGLDYLLNRAARETKENPKSLKGNAILATGLMLIAASSSLSVVLSHSLVMGQLSGALTATLGALAVLAWIIRTASLNPSLGPLICLLLTLPWLSIYTTLPTITVIFLALAPLALIPAFKDRPLIQEAALRLSLVSLPAVAAIITAWQLG